MNDSELRKELASIRNLLNEVLVNQDILAKRINADTAIKAVQTERAVELARLRRTADKATRRIATVDWAIAFQLSDRVDGLGEPAGALWLIQQSTWGIKALFL